MSKKKIETEKVETKENVTDDLPFKMETTETEVKTPVINVITDEKSEPTIPAKEYKVPGRPIVATSKRQQRLIEMEVRRLTGQIKKGRPASSDSVRQQKEREKAEKRAAGLLKPGRPKYTNEEKAEADKLKAQREAERNERIKELAKKYASTGTTDVDVILDAVNTEMNEEKVTA